MPNYYAISKETLDGIGDSIRAVTGSNKLFTPDEMMDEIKTIMDAATFVLVDKDGNEYPAVYVDSNIVFTATEDDIRKGRTAVTAEGVVVGTKEIPNYRAEEGCNTIKPNKPMTIPLFSDMCNYTTLQCIICELNETPDNSVSANKVVIKDKVYNVRSSDPLATITVDSVMQSIDLGFINDQPRSMVIRYMIIKEDT